MAHRYFLLDKPFDVLSQFTREMPEHRTLADVYDFPGDVYPVGRLDRDSEGLLILTNDGSLNHKLLNPAHYHPRTYWVQVEGEPDPAALKALAAGPSIRIKGKDHRSRPLLVERIAPAVAPRNPPIRYRKNVADSWLSLTLTEGKNRQVRRICAAVGHPVLRLIRHAIVDVSRADLEGESVREVDRDWLYRRLELR
ncbi:23S rRNA pseudouridine2457 synthase [Lewinella marina]|uniref:Pseudouridine synthase n=1 Tax=Neolewinella marina TaxID=438751 RepID=A0A2G0CFN3_9BACT|nr:pseudouridine synthase [Neolewinella marina]NJB85528.1 23S rRNA pseudouridine2457 synthase [Neolewinella marina]PHK98784.1 pseudouridine synthase [Neolewinella marina]